MRLQYVIKFLIMFISLSHSLQVDVALQADVM